MNPNDKNDFVTDAASATRGAALIAALEAFDDEFVALLEEDRRAALPLQGRDSL
ncbi:MAG: hypothetical protein ACLGHB_04025 [Gammaproteobacteria bacterium]